MNKMSGSKPEVSHGRGVLVELELFNKYFVENAQKKARHGNCLEIFLLDTHKTTF